MKAPVMVTVDATDSVGGYIVSEMERALSLRYAGISLNDMVTWINAMRSAVPPKHADSAEIFIDIDHDDRFGAEARVRLKYKRPETGHDRAERRRRSSSLRKENEASEKKTLAALLAKYGQPVAQSPVASPEGGPQKSKKGR